MASTGGVTIIAGNGNAAFGKIEMSDIRTGTLPLGGGFTVKGSATGQSGGVKMEKSQVSANGAMLFETGGLGTTEVKENRLISSTSITVKTASNGSCVATPNFVMQAPVVNACTPALSPLRLSIFPNPSSDGTLNIKLDETTDPKDVSIVNNRGGMTKSWKADTSENLTTEGLKTGSYTIQVINNKTGQKSSMKFIVD